MALLETKHTRGKRLVRELLEKKIRNLKSVGANMSDDWAGWSEIETYETRIREDTYYGR